MLIRTQDKTRLVSIGKMGDIFIVPGSCSVSINIKSVGTVGIYATNPEAIRVLNEMELYYKRALNGNINTFHMPTSSIMNTEQSC